MKIADKDVGDNADNFYWFCAVNDYNPKWLKLMIPVLIEAWKNDDNSTVDKIKKELFTDGMKYKKLEEDSEDEKPKDINDAN